MLVLLLIAFIQSLLEDVVYQRYASLSYNFALVARRVIGI